MIIYGWNNKTIKQAPLENMACDNCQEQNLFLTIYSKYVHIFWIPLFPFKKSALMHCGHCQKATEEKQMTPDFKEKIKQLKNSVSTPKYLYSGLIIIVLAIGYFSFAGSQAKKMEQAFLEEPMEGDIYKNIDKTEETTYKYYLWKVAKVENDSVFVSPSSYSYDGIPTKLEPEDGFYNFSYAIHKNELRDMYEKGEVKKILRDYDGESTGFNRVVAYPSPVTTDSIQ
ncbi:zinc-ribbon domain-containing protein [Fulvivirga sp. M361]|uniref:zinc-ribbon domain-containing protein n=1 Tax=Fulvivirga sp. M361 TaxID=2594266 RepID=UPI00117BA8A9|nr:zinc-ribbon domain-containing protein [Fulvivirga sp. M361]TRX54279.1 zinc-ribbon domain-containing protein [Fulvivirga sp. M361]